jgi:hypothetical protein
MADWATISSLATAGGTLVLAVATFASVRSSRRSALVAEESLLASVRPILMPSRLDDPQLKVGFVDNHWVRVDGGRGTVEVTEDAVYMTMSLRNAGTGVAVLHGWRLEGPDNFQRQERPPIDNMHRLTRDIYLPAGDVYFWQGAIREVDHPDRDLVEKQLAGGERVVVDVLYGDMQGGQRVVTRFSLLPVESGGYVVALSRHWNIDRPDPR